MIGVAANAIAWGIGLLLVRLLWSPERLDGTRLLRAVLAIGVGLGVVTLLWFLWLVLLGRAAQPMVVAAEAALLAALVAFNLRAASGRSPGARRVDAVARPCMATKLAMAALLVVAAAAMTTFGVASAVSPHGVFDATAIWNLRALLLADSGPAWQRALDGASLQHVDYPLLLPLAVARGWQYAGGTTGLVPIGIAAAFTFGIAGLLYAVLQPRRGVVAAAAAAAVLLASPAFLAHGAMQYADVPLAFFELAAVAVLWRDGAPAPRDRRTLLLAGVMVGFAAWTKNEGMLFAIVLPVVMVGLAGGGGRRRALGEACTMALGAAPALAAVVVLKVAFVPPNDVVERLATADGSSRLVDGSRWLTVVRSIGDSFWGFGVASVAALAVWCLSHRRRRSWLPAAVAGVVLIGYALVYVLTSTNIVWHVGTSCQRLCLHVLPLLVLTIFSGSRDGAPRPAALTS